MKIFNKTNNGITDLSDIINDGVKTIIKSNDPVEVNYDDLDILSRFVMLEDEYVNYENVRKEYQVDHVLTEKKYLNKEGSEGMFSIFYYDYMCQHTKSYLYQYGKLGYVSGFKELVSDKINFNWDLFEIKESNYQESLVDILIQKLNVELNKVNKILFGINMGDASALFFITDIAKYNVLKSRKSTFYSLYNYDYISQFYGEIFEVISGEYKVIKTGDYVELKNEKYVSLFNNNNIEIHKENMQLKIEKII